MRAKGIEFMRKVALGLDPRQTMDSRASKGNRYIGEVFEEYLTLKEQPKQVIGKKAAHRVSRKTIQTRLSIWNRHLKPLWKDILIGNLTVEDIDMALLSILQKGEEITPGPRARSMHSTTVSTRKLVMGFIRWAKSEKLFAGRDPFVENMPVSISDESDVERTLEAHEVAVLWEATRRLERQGWSFARLPRILILTGARLGELADMPLTEAARIFRRGMWGPVGQPAPRMERRTTCRWSAWRPRKCGRRWRRRRSAIPARRTGKPSHQRRPEAGGELIDVLFPLFNQRQKVKLDATCAKVASEWGVPPMLPWTLHDLRRSFATKLGDLEVEPWLIRSLINHVSKKDHQEDDSKKGHTWRYLRSEFTSAKVKALTALDAHIAGIIATDYRAAQRQAA